MVTQGYQLLAGATVVFGPGLALLVALGVRSKLWWAGLSAPVTLGVVVVASCVTGLTGIPFSVLSVAGVLVVGLAATFAVRWWSLRRRPARSDVVESSEESLTGGGLRAAKAIGGLAMLGGIGLAVLTWFRGLGTWATPTQEHDTITHSFMTAYIHYSGNAAPWQLRPLNVVTGTPVGFYPPGFPQLSALVTGLTGGDPMTGMNIATVALLAIAWPLSIAALAAAVIRVAGRAQGWTYVAAGIAALVAAGLYRPTIAFAHDGGVLPQAVSLVLVPGIVAAMLTIGARQWSGSVAIGVAAAGVVAVHPSAAVSLVCSAGAAFIGLLFTGAGRVRLRELARPLLVLVAAAAVVALPALIWLLSKGVSASRDKLDVGARSLGNAVDHTIWLTYTGYLDPSNQLRQAAIGLMALVAAVSIVALRRGWPILVMWAFWAITSIVVQLDPNGLVVDTVGSAFYKVFNRINGHTYVLIPALIGVAGALIAAGVLHALRSWRLAPIAVMAALVLVGVAFSGLVLRGYVERNAAALAGRYSAPDFERYSQADYDAIKWLADHVRPGEMIMNNGNDGSTLAYVRYGLPVINVSSMGAGTAPYTIALLSKFNTYPHNAEIRQMLVDHNVKWVYVDDNPPPIGANPRGWVGKSMYSTAPGLENVSALPGMSMAFRSGPVTVYRLDLPPIG